MNAVVALPDLHQGLELPKDPTKPSLTASEPKILQNAFNTSLERILSTQLKVHQEAWNIVSDPEDIFGLAHRVMEDAHDYNSVLTVLWTSWSWKWNFINMLSGLFWDELRRFREVNMDGGHTFEVGHTFNEKVAVLLGELDFFFKELWKEVRYSTAPGHMLSDKETFQEIYAKEQVAVGFLVKFFHENESFVQKLLYSKHKLERELGRHLTWLHVQAKHEDARRFIVLDGVNALGVLHDFLQAVRQDDIRVHKVMIKPDLAAAMLKIIIRDVFGWDVNGEAKRDIDEIVSFRINEIYFILKLYVFPALNEKDIKILDIAFEGEGLGKNYIRKTLIPAFEKHWHAALERLMRLSKTDETSERIDWTHGYVNLIIDGFQAHAS